MEDEIKKILDQELKKEARLYTEIAKCDSKIANISAPSSLRDGVFQGIREIEAEAEKERLSKEEKELLRLGKIYKKKRKMKKYWLLAATLVFALALGITSMGGAEKVFEKVCWMMGGREQTNFDSVDEDIKTAEACDEEEIYQEMEDELGFSPVRMMYLPEGMGFMKAVKGDEVQGIQLFYGRNGDMEVEYFIRPNYRVSSLGADMEDELSDKYTIEVGNMLIEVKEYEVESAKNSRWVAEFSYQEVYYSILAVDMEKAEFENIIKNLYFS